MIYKQSENSSPLVDKILSEISEGLQHIRDREIYTTGKVLRGDKSQLTRSTGAGALTSSAAKELGPKAVELRNKKATSVSLPNLSNVKEEISLVEKILGEEKCGKGMYWCNTDKVCKPLPEGMKIPGQKIKPTEVGIGKAVDGSCTHTKKGKSCPVHGMDQCPISEEKDPKGPVKSYKSPEELAKKHGVSVEEIKKQLEIGTKVEFEHTTSKSSARITALHHLEEIPDYYSRLVKMEGEAEMKEAKKYMTKEEDPCWKGYEMVGFKKKRGKKVPNCVPVTEATTRLPMQTGQLLRVLVNWRGKHISVQMFFPQLGTPKRDEITYAVNKIYPESRVISYVPCEMDSSTPIVQVKEEKEGGDSSKKPLNKPMRTPGERKKFKVYVRNSQGNIVTVRFGDPNMEIKRDDPDRLAAFRARHNCADAKDKTTPKYWSCYQWRAGKKVED
jgi:hypothetical protein